MRVGPAGTAVEASSHSIVTTSRELFYWPAVLVTFALGAAVGDWVLDLTGWGPGVSVLLPAGLIAAVTMGRRLGANAVLSFWLACIPTRPLGANLGDWRAPPADHGLGLGGMAARKMTLARAVVGMIESVCTAAYPGSSRIRCSTDIAGSDISPDGPVGYTTTVLPRRCRHITLRQVSRG